MTNKSPAKRDEKGRFVPGKSGNPNGRPVGSKNAITLLKQSLELQLREQASDDMAQVMRTAIELAKAGDRSMIKLLLELHMTKGTTDSDRDAKERVSINIKGPEKPVIDITPTKDDDE